MIQVPRDDRSVIGQWWWTVDRWSLGAILAIMAFGVMLTLAASPPAAERIGADSFLFAKRQFLFLPLALVVMLAISLASPRHVRRLALLVFCGSIVLLAATFVIGAVLAAIAGVMYASNYGTAQHAMGFLPGLKAFTAAVFGGIGNLAGAVVGAILLGLIESIGAGYIGELTGGVLGSHYSDIFAFIVLIIVLTLRPSGLLGERVADRA